MKILDYLFSALGMIPYLMILIGASIYYNKYKKISPLLIITATVFNLLIFVYHRFIWPLLIHNEAYRDLITDQSFFRVISLFGTLFHIIFAVGFIMIILEIINSKASAEA